MNITGFNLRIGDREVRLLTDPPDNARIPKKVSPPISDKFPTTNTPTLVKIRYVNIHLDKVILMYID